MNYEHTQKVSVVRYFLLVSLFVLGPLIPGYIWWSYPLFVVLMQVLLLPLIFFLFIFPFSQSTISLTSDYLEFRFRYGWPKLEIDLLDIHSAETTEVSLWRGWGINTDIKGRKIWRIRERKCIEILKKDGKRFLLGTNDAETLTMFLSSALEKT
tara:strand:- start:1025 stop:1486 length:462 start_codon:yes stop_codon:yes gene_type:complete